MSLKLTQEVVLERFKQAQPYFNYTNTVFTSRLEKLLISCNLHGEYETTYHNFMRSSDTGCCPECVKKKISSIATGKILDSSKIIAELAEKFPKMDFSNSEYFGSRKSIKGVCPIHGEFKGLIQTLRESPTGCRKCAYENKNKYLIVNKDSNIKALIDKYPNLDFSNTVYERTNKKFKVVCNIHGEFSTTLTTIEASPKGCPRCSVTNDRISQDLIIKRLTERHPHMSYDSLIYKGINDKVAVTCKTHGTSEVYISSFIRSVKGCPICSGSGPSQPEIDIKDYILSLGIKEEDIITSYRPDWMEGKELDIYIPKYNLAIEFNGSVYHHSSTSKYVSSFCKSTSKHKDYHLNKWKSCSNNNVTLLSIYDFMWQDTHKQSLLKCKIKYHLNFSKRLYARKCIIKPVDLKIAKEFLESNHIEKFGSYLKDLTAFGLYYKDKLVMVTTVGYVYEQSAKDFRLKINRMCSLKDTVVVGGLSKLHKHILKEYSVDSVSYLITLYTGSSTLKSFDYTLKAPRYYWVKPGSGRVTVYSRNKTQKSKLESLFDVPVLDSDTESTYMERLGYLKVYDNGLAEISF